MFTFLFHLRIYTMKSIYTFSAALFLFLCSCGSSTDTDAGLSSDVRDYMYTGNPGTEIIMTETHTETDTSGVTHTPKVGTYLTTIIERDAMHPIGGKSIRVRQEGRYPGSNPSIHDSVYYSIYDNSIVRFSSIKDSANAIYAKNPLVAGTHLVIHGQTLIVKSVGEIVNTTYKPLKAVLLEAIDSSVSTSTKLKTVHTTRIYLAPEVFLARIESSHVTYYPNDKTNIESNVADLVQYTKK